MNINQREILKMAIKLPKRLAANTNLNLHYEDTYLGMQLIPGHGPYVVEYLDKAYATIQDSLTEHPRTTAFRFDLRLPSWMDPELIQHGRLIERFIASLKHRLEASRDKAEARGGRVHYTSVRYIWAKEFGDSGVPHYHFAILVNGHAYHRIGCYDSQGDNMLNRIKGAWSSALGINEWDGYGLVHVPANAVYRIDGKLDLEGIAALFRRVSYFAKVESKIYGGRRHSFGCSRVRGSR